MFENLKNLLLKETIIVNLLRSFFAGVVWMIVSMASGSGADSSVFFFPIAAPVLLLVFYLLSQILRIVKLGGVGSLLCILMAVPGDPFVFILKQISPALVPVEKFGFLNFAPMFYVYDTVPAAKQAMGETTDKCSYKGRVIAEKKGVVLGFSWPHAATIFSIDEDWLVKREGREIGWIDTSGQIREGFKGDINATLAPGKVVGKIKNNRFFINNDIYGKLENF